MVSTINNTFIGYIKDNNIEKVKCLLDLKDQINLDINHKDCDKNTPLTFALLNGYIESAKLLIDYGADVNIKGQREHTPLQIAISSNMEEIVKLLLKCGVDFKYKDNNGLTLLMFTAMNNKIEIAKMLIEKGVDINARNNNCKICVKNLHFISSFIICFKHIS